MSNECGTSLLAKCIRTTDVTVLNLQRGKPEVKLHSEKTEKSSIVQKFTFHSR